MLEGSDVSPIVFLILVNLLILALGCVLDATTIILAIVTYIAYKLRQVIRHPKEFRRVSRGFKTLAKYLVKK